jgi:hypothetical protein
MKNKGNIITKDQFILDPQEIKLKCNNNLIRLQHHNHSYKPGDMISINNITLPHDKLNIINDDGSTILEIPKGADFMKILFPHGVLKCEQGEYYEIELNGVKGIKNGSSRTLNGIPIDIINTKHKIMFELEPTNYSHLELCDDYFVSSPNYFFIKFNMVAMSCLSDDNINKPYLFELTRHYIAGINIDHLLELSNGAIIKNCDQNGYDIELCSAKPLYDECCMMEGICVSKIISTKICGLLNNYVMNLGKTYNNIYSVRLCSTEFPNMKSRIFINDCCINWINYDETCSNKIYIKSGCYKLHELTKYLTEESKNNPNSMDKNGYVNFLDFSVDTIRDNNCIAIKSYKYLEIDNPFKCCHDKITLLHPDHNIKVGSLIKLVSNNPDLIVGKRRIIMNHWYHVTCIFDKDSYSIKPVLSKLKPIEDTNAVLPKGNSIGILIPQLFCIQYPKCTTFCELLKIPNSCKFSECIRTKCFNNNFDYFYMIIKPFQTFDLSVSNIYSPFAKIQLGSNDCCSNNKILYNTFVDIPKVYYDPIKDISSLEISFVDPTGTPLNFGNLNHSFTLEFVTIDDSPTGTLINPNTMKSYGIKVVE